MLFIRTAAAEQWIQDNPGVMPVMSEFKVGSAFAYTPESTMTDLQGAILFTGVPSSELVEEGVWLYEAVMDQSVGPFYWGEVGLYRNGVLFAIGCSSTQIWKGATENSVQGNNATIQVYLHANAAESIAQIGNSSNELNVHVAPGVSSLPPAHLAYPNVIAVPSPLDPECSTLATALGGVWSLSGWSITRYQGALVSATASTLTLPSSISPPTASGEYIVVILTGRSAGLIRSVVGYDSLARRITLDAPLPITPLATDTVRVLQSFAAANVEDLPSFLWSLSSELTANDLNQLTDLDVFFNPLLKRNGSAPMTGNLGMGGNRVVNLGLPTDDSDAATKLYVDESVAGFATPADISNAVDGLATEAYVISATSSLASTGAMNLAIAAAIDGLATEAFVTSSLDGLATEAFATSAAAAATVGFATEAYVTSAISGLASTSYVDSAVVFALDDYLLVNGSRALTGNLSLGSNRVTNLADPLSAQDAATRAYVLASVSGLASETFVNSAVADLVSNGALAAAIADFATEAHVAAAVAPLATTVYVDAEIADAETSSTNKANAALASANAFSTALIVQSVTSGDTTHAPSGGAVFSAIAAAVAGLATQTYANNAAAAAVADRATVLYVDNAVADLASTTYVTSALANYVTTTALNTAIANFTTEAYVLSLVADFATESYVTSALVGRATEAYVDGIADTKQDTLVSGTSIKTINGNSLLGSGDIVIAPGSDVTSVNGQTGAVVLTAASVGAQPTLVSGTNIKTVGGTSILGAGNIPFPVTSINSQTGAVTLTAVDVGAQATLVSGTNIKTINGVSVLGSGDMTIGGAVDSVNGQTGVVVLDAADVGALALADVDDVSTTPVTPTAGDLILVQRAGDWSVAEVDTLIGGGSSMTAADIRDSLTTLTGADRLSATAIKDLPTLSPGDVVTVAHDGAGEDPTVGDTLTATFAAGWSGTVQWTRDGVNISGATSLTYVLVEDDVAALVRPVVTALVFTGEGFTIAAAPPPGGAMSIVQAAAVNSDYRPAATPTFTNPVASGNDVAVLLLVSSPSIVITPPAGFTKVGETVNVSDSGQSAQVFLRTNVTDGGTAFTFTLASSQYVQAIAIESPNIGALDYISDMEGGWGNTSGGHNIAFNAAAAGSLALVVSNGGSQTIGAGTPPLTLYGLADSYDHCFAGIFPDAGANTAAWTYSASSTSWHALAVFSPA